MTNQVFTFEVLTAQLDNNGTFDVDYISNEIETVCINTRELYAETINKRRAARSVAIEYLMYWVNCLLRFAGYRGYYATNKQVMNFDRQHGGALDRVLCEIVEYIKAYREEV